MPIGNINDENRDAFYLVGSEGIFDLIIPFYYSFKEYKFFLTRTDIAQIVEEIYVLLIELSIPIDVFQI